MIERRTATSIYAAPLTVPGLSDCYFYHSIDIPGYGPVDGDWDLRKGVDQYLGGVDFTQKRVLEMGTADGFLAFEMERRGAEVVSYDLSEQDAWDVVPYAQYDHRAFLHHYQADTPRMNNAYWLCHRAFNSSARMVYGHASALPEAIGPVDIATFGSILVHLRDPLTAIERALRLTRETVIVTDLLGRGLRHYLRFIPLRWQRPTFTFLPDWRRAEPKDAWCYLSPALVVRILGVFGFEQTEVRYHRQLYHGRPTWLFTVVGSRTR